MIYSRSGMGSKKHGISGIAPKSPKMRHHMKMEAERNSIKSTPSRCHYKSVSDALKGGNSY